MAIRYPEVLELAPPARTLSWTDRDTLLYALALGMGDAPHEPSALAFTFENAQRVVPSFAATLARSAIPFAEIGFNYALLVHGEQRAEFHRNLPPAGSASAQARIVGAYDKGPGKGALILCQVQLAEPESGAKLATLTWNFFARGDGGFGGPASGAPEPHQVPERAPDLSVDIATRGDQALLYRLLGDRNPLHADPETARAAGFPGPILHGLCTYGITCRAVLESFADGDPARISSHQARFSAPVFPGETVSVDLWRDAAVVSFEARVKSRNAAVIKNGRTLLR